MTDGNNDNHNNGSSPRKSLISTIKSLRLTERTWKLIAIAACGAAVVFLVIWIVTLNSIPPAEIPEEPQTEEQTGEESGYQYEYTPEEMNVSSVSLAGKRIIVDAGHGGFDTGSIAGDGKTEKDINLEISQKLKNRLEQYGATVIMTRMTDDALGEDKESDFEERERIIAASNADVFVSVHQNEYTDNPDAKGPQVFFVAQGSVGKRLAVCIQDVINYELSIESPRMALPADYRILRTGGQPSCTVECGFLSNTEENVLLQDENYQQRMADAIADGIRLYVKTFE